jgi:hypothetical protein
MSEKADRVAVIALLFGLTVSFLLVYTAEVARCAKSKIRRGSR